ncbi:Zn-dependent hydrolase [Ensifer soli]|uniref:Zn-dependent hydrolase n=1 Tax=Ciceribacter sp. sgz301302 TaxID=3342379 RepID=UPI0035BB91DA
MALITPDIDGERLWRRLMELAGIGATPGGGVDRQALSDGEAEAWRLVIGWGEAAGLEASTDAAANLFLTLPGRDRALPCLLAGSHLDSQPTGGRFDGAFGVMAALEVVTALAGRSIVPERDVTVVAWMNEEGSRFAPGMMGSEAFAGLRPIEAIRAVRDADGETAGAAIDRLLARFPRLARRPLGFPVHAYVEPHIEQHTLLEASGAVIGAVTGIQGKKTFDIDVHGAKGHAGTKDMALRRDAVVAFARIMTALQERIGHHDPLVKFTVGKVDVTPNAPSVIAERVRFRIDLRHPDNAVLEACGHLVAEICEAKAPPCRAEVRTLVAAPSNGFDPHLQRLVLDHARARGYPAMPLLSYAGHDARHLAAIAPSAMIFIPCRDGISHDESEWAEPEHVAAGAQVLFDVVRDVAAGFRPR